MKVNRKQKSLYFERYYKLYEETDISVRELKCKLYNDLHAQKRLGITLNTVDNFWTALMDGVYEPGKLNIIPQKYVLY